MLAVPPDTPVKIPDDVPMVATEGGDALHVPPEGASLRAIINDGHTAPGPVMGCGNGLTVTGVETKQPVLSV